MRIHPPTFGSRALAAALITGLITASASAQVYSYDDGSTENALNIAGLTEIGFLHGFDAVGGADSIGEVQYSVGTALAPPGQLDGNDVRIGIWSDPDGDGDPTDAVLLYISSVFPAVQTNSDTKVSHVVSPAVDVTGSFFVGVLTASVAGQFPVGLDQSSAPQPGRTYLVSTDTGVIDAAALSSNTPGLASVGGTVFLLDAIGGGDSSVGTVYCTPAVANSTGSPAEISATGSLDLTLNDLTLSVSSLPTNSFGFFIGSDTQNFVANPGGSQGNLCLGGSIGRFLQDIQNSGSAGTFTISVDLTAIPQPSGTATVLAGQTWNFQGWYRDANPTPVSNFTDAVSITY